LFTRFRWRAGESFEFQGQKVPNRTENRKLDLQKVKIATNVFCKQSDASSANKEGLLAFACGVVSSHTLGRFEMPDKATKKAPAKKPAAKKPAAKKAPAKKVAAKKTAAKKAPTKKVAAKKTAAKKAPAKKAAAKKTAAKKATAKK